MPRALEHLDTLRALRRTPQSLYELEPAVRALIQAAERERLLAARRFDLLTAEDLRRVRAGAAELLQDLEDRAA